MNYENFKDTLPSKPSELILLALKDIKAVEKKKGYKIDMLNWHDPIHSFCYVCAAGSVMTNTLKVKKNEELLPSSFCGSVATKLRAINYFREGSTYTGLMELGYPYVQIEKIVEKVPGREITSYSNNKEQFKKELTKFAKEFQAIGE